MSILVSRTGASSDRKRARCQVGACGLFEAPIFFVAALPASKPEATSLALSDVGDCHDLFWLRRFQFLEPLRRAGHQQNDQHDHRSHEQ